MAINYGANYIGVDRDRYDAGNKFYSQDRFLQGVGLDKPAITFNSSPDNSGIMGMYPRYPYPPIITQNEGDGGGITFGIDKGVTADASAAGGYNRNPDGSLFNSPEVEEEIAAARNKDRLKQAAKFGLFALNPMGYILGTGINRVVGFAKDKFFGGDSDGGSGGGGKGKGKGNRNVDYYTGSDEEDKDNEMTGPTGVDAGTADIQDYADIDTRAEGGRVGYKDGYSVQDDMTDYAENVGKEANPGGGFKDSGDTGGDNPPPTYSSNEPPRSNLNFNLVEYIDPAFSYANRFGTLGGILNTTRTIQEEEPVGSLGYVDPSGNFGIGYDTDLGVVSNANLGNLNLGYTGVGGPTLNYTGGFANDDGRFGVNYNKDSGLNLGVSYNKRFNNGGIVGLYR